MRIEIVMLMSAAGASLFLISFALTGSVGWVLRVLSLILLTVGAIGLMARVSQ